MSKESAINDVVFPVRLEDITLAYGDGKPLKGFKAVVDCETGHVFSVVTRNYRLITNAEALEFGMNCFSRLFRMVDPGDMKPYKIHMPKTRSFCHVDFLYRDGASTMFSRQDVWYPFLRITNCYNRVHAPSVRIGFLRKVCENGLVMRSEQARFSICHYMDHDGSISVPELERIEELEGKFMATLYRLAEIPVPRKYMWELAKKVFGMKKPRKENEYARLCYRDKRKHIEGLARTYFTEMGENGYAALNVLTDFATRPRGYSSRAVVLHSLQSRVSGWMDSFLEDIRGRSFYEYIAAA